MSRPPISTRQLNDFLDLLAEIGNVSKCCEALNLPRSRIYEKRMKNKTFARKWAIAKDVAIARLEDESWRRAFEGILKPVFYKGEQLKTADGKPYFERTYSDTLLMHRLNAERPDKYQYRQKIDGTLDANITVKVVKFATDGNNDTK